jgi:hypothetical protein
MEIKGTKKQDVSKEILEKLVKLKTLSEHGGTLGECEAAAGMLQSLLSKHGLDIEALDDFTGADEKKIGHFFSELGDGQTRGYTLYDTKHTLLAGIAYANYCQIIYRKTTNRSNAQLKQFTIVGTRGACDATLSIYGWLWTILRKAAMGRTVELGEPRAYCISFIRAACHRIHERFHELRDVAEATTNNSKELVLAKDARIQKYVEDLFGGFLEKQAVKSNSLELAAAHDGLSFANGLQLNPQIQQGGAARLLPGK